MGNPKKPVEWHVMMGNYRPSRHGPLPGATSSPPNPAAAPAAPEALSAEAKAWQDVLEWSEFVEVFGDLPDGLTEEQARRRAKAKWREHGPALVRHWGPERSRESWAWKRWGAP